MNVLRFDSERAWVGAICSLWRDRLRTNPGLTMCLPTGLTPLPIYAEMVASRRAGLVSFDRARVFALDEFGDLEEGDPGRTRNTLLTHVVGPAGIPEASCRFLDPGHSDVAEHCADYDHAVGGVFDLVLLGLGTNGHLGMNEPGSPADSPTRRVDLADSTIAASARYFDHDRLPRWGLTVGLGAILAAREVWLLARGAAKAEVVHQMLTGPITEDLPASLLRRHPNCSVFLDDDAAQAPG